MKIAIVMSGSLPIPAVKGGGVETLVQHFIDENEKEKKFNIRLYTVCGAEKYQNRYKQTEFININRNFRFDKIVKKINPFLYSINRRTIKIAKLRLLDSYEREVVKKLKKDDSEVFIFENNLLLVGAQKKDKRKIIFHAHYDDVRPGISEFDKKRFLYCYKKISMNIGVSSFINRRIKEIIGENTQYRTVKNCINLDSYRKLTQKEIVDIKNKYRIPNELPVVIYSGRITKEKGVRQLIEAFTNVRIKACLLIVGGVFYSDNTSDSFLEELKQMARSSINPIIFTGYVSHTEIPYLLGASDIAVVPTYDVEEAAGLVVVEAMAAGKMVIISDSGAMNEYAADTAIKISRGENFIKELSAKLTEVCENVELCKQYGTKAKEKSLQYNSNMYYSQISQIIFDVINENE